MASDKTPLRQRPYPAETDAPDVAADIQALALSLDNAPNVTQGTLANRPSTGMVAGDRYYVKGDSTLTNNGIEWIYDGSSWVEIGGETPIGSCVIYFGQSDPADTNWLIADGRSLSSDQYPVLAAVIGNGYGPSTSTTFSLPDMRQRFPLGKKAAGASGSGANLGEKGGAIDHTHTIPGLSIPGLAIANIACSVVGALPLSGAGWAQIGMDAADVIWGPTPGAWTPSWAFTAQNGLRTADSVAQTYGAALGGTTGSGVLSGNTATSTTGTGVTGSGTSGVQNPPYMTVNYIIRVS